MQSTIDNLQFPMPPSRRLQNSTQSNRILQNPTKTRVCAHAREGNRDSRLRGNDRMGGGMT